MTQTVTGVVQAVEARETSIGTMYNLKVNGESYGYGKYAPKAKAGDTVTFGVTYRGKYANVDTKNFQVTPGTGAPPSVSAPSKGNGGAKDDYWERKEATDVARQIIISKQSALNSALAFVGLMQTAGALPPAPAKARDGAKVLEGLVEYYRDVFYKQATGADFDSTANSTKTTTVAGVDDADEEDNAGGGW